MSRPLALALALLFGLSETATADTRSLSLAGQVRDISDAPVPGARVTVRHAGMGFEAVVRTDGQGRFSVEVRPGVYEVSAEAEGFSVSQRTVGVGVPPAAGGDLRLVLLPGAFSEQITVVGTRLAAGPEALRRIPGSVDLLDRAQLEAARVFNFSEALRKAPGVHVRDEEGFGLRPNIGIRGLNPTRSTKVLLLEDGLPLAYAPYGDNSSYYHPPIERYEEIEVLKGSGQIAYGPVTVGGVVNYITPGPPARPAATVRLAGGNRGYKSGHAQAGGTWGRVGLLLDVLHKRGDGSRDNLHSRLNDVNLKGVLDLGRSHTLTLKGSAYTEDSQLTYSGLRLDEFQADPRQNPFVNDDFAGRRFGASARHTWVLGDRHLLTTQAYGSIFSRDWWRQSSNSGQRPNDAADPACGGMANLLTACGNEGRLRDYHTGGLEPRLRFGHRLFGLHSEAELGLRAHFELQQRRQRNGETPTARTGRLVEDNRRENQAFSGFLRNRFLAGRFTLTPGVRYEAVRYERTNHLGAGGMGVSGRTSLGYWVPGLGLAWSAGDGVSVFAGAHRGFAPPRTEDVINNTTGGAVDLDPELSWNFEAGLRAQVRRGLRLEGTVFRMDYENQVVPASLAGGQGATLTNGGQTLHQGFELSARLDSGALTGSAHNAFLRAAFTMVPVARFEGIRTSSVSGSGGVSVSGHRLPYAPERHLTAALGYSGPSGLTAQLEAVHVSEQFTDDLNTLAPTADGQRGLIEGSTVWNATVNYELRALRSTLFLAVKNLTDALYVVDRSRGILPGQPRLVQAGVVARF